MIYKWDKINEIKRENFIIFDTIIESKVNSNSGKISNFTKIISNDWVNIIPVTKDNKFVLIEQYRHGTDEFTLEVPGGLVEKNELPLLAAKRECIEETGYSSDLEAILIGEIEPNPAFMNNKCYTYLWENCKLNSLQNLDENEEIKVVEYSYDEILEMVRSGKIKHSIVLNALYFYHLYKNK